MEFSQDDFNRFLKQYRALSVERLEIENEILRFYESLVIDNIAIIVSDKLKVITSLRKRLSIVNQEMKKIDRKILELFKDS
jgi:phosphosulfolactate synthase (CoM biosynthesis protein A)